jgi:lipopolysaccharide export system protein LptC
VQGTENPDLVTLDKPVAKLTMNDGTVLDGHAASGLYEQKTQKLNLEGDVHLNTSDGYTLITEELRVDIATQKTYSGRDVRVEGKTGTLEAKGLEGDVETGTMIFPGPAKIILYNNPNTPEPKVSAP